MKLQYDFGHQVRLVTRCGEGHGAGDGDPFA